jgi:hypothetical protein
MHRIELKRATKSKQSKVKYGIEFYYLNRDEMFITGIMKILCLSATKFMFVIFVLRWTLFVRQDS